MTIGIYFMFRLWSDTTVKRLTASGQDSTPAGRNETARVGEVAAPRGSRNSRV
jgi:hypothetical protein